MRSVLLMEREKDGGWARDAPINIYTRSAVSSEQFVVSRSFWTPKIVTPSSTYMHMYDFIVLEERGTFKCHEISTMKSVCPKGSNSCPGDLPTKSYTALRKCPNTRHFSNENSCYYQ